MKKSVNDQITELWGLDIDQLESHFANSLEQKYADNDSESDEEQPLSDQRKSLAERVHLLQKDITEAVCIKYCEKRNDEGLQVAVTIADALVSLYVEWPLPISYISVFLVKKGLLDKWCKCEN